MTRLCVTTGVWLLVCTVLVFARNPGFKARITDRGLKYANNFAIKAMADTVRGMHIPDQSGYHTVNYKLYNIRVTQFNPPPSSISVDTGRGLSWSILDARISIRGDFKYSKWWIIRGSGTFTVSVSSTSVLLGVDIGKDTKGRPSISARSCTSDTKEVDFRFHGSWLSWLFNYFRKRIGSNIKNYLNAQLCDKIKNEVNNGARDKLSKLQVTMPLGKNFLLDYRLTQTPVFKTKYMETFHKGEVLWKDDPHRGSPLVAPLMPTYSDTSSMLYLWLSEYLLNTIGYQAQKHGFLTFNLTKEHLPPKIKDVLNTTCEGVIPLCIGKFIPKIGQMYPHSDVNLHMRTSSAPTTSITKDGIFVNFAGELEMYAERPGKISPAYLLTLGGEMSTSLNVSVNSQLLYAEIQDIQLQLKFEKSAVGNVSSHVDLLQFLINHVLKLFLVPRLNELGKEGFPLPMSKEVKFQNTKITLTEDVLLLSTDVKYEPSEDAVDDASGPLKFEPVVDLNI